MIGYDLLVWRCSVMGMWFVWLVGSHPGPLPLRDLCTTSVIAASTVNPASTVIPANAGRLPDGTSIQSGGATGIDKGCCANIPPSGRGGTSIRESLNR